LPRFPLPGFLFAALALALVHGPLLSTPPLFDEGPFLFGGSESRGAVLGMQWLPIELSLLGSDARAHRVFAFVLEFALLALAAFAPLVRGSRAPNLLLLALAAYLVHPWRTESFVRLGSRAVIVSEVLLLVGWIVAWSAPGGAQMAAGAKGRVVAGLLLLAAGASGMPGALAFALPPLLLARGVDAPRARAVALALLVGLCAWWIAAPPAATLASTFAGLDLFARPWATGLVHHAGAPLWMLAGGAILLVLLALLRRQRDALAAAATAAAALVFVAAPALRPSRTGLELVGAGITPDAWLPMLVLLLFAAWRLAGATAWSTLPLFALAALSFGSGAVHARRFESEETLVDHGIVMAPDSVELRLAKAQLVLSHVRSLPPERARDAASAALQASERALLRRPDDVAAATLKCLALALMARLDDARALSDRLLALHPEDWRTRACRAELESLAGDDLVALPWLRAAVEAHPVPFLRARQTDLIDRIYEQIRVDLADRRWESARLRCERLAAIAPEELEARTTWVDTFTLAGDLPRALEACRKLYGERPHERAIVQRLASLYERLGQAAEANEFRRILLTLPDERAAPRR
jgi:tetratricopeptide (TPR) repeat protein